MRPRSSSFALALALSLSLSALAKEKTVTPDCATRGQTGQRYAAFYEKVELEALAQAVSNATCKTFILPANLSGKVSLIGPSEQPARLTADELYAAFLSVLEANGLTVYPQGQFLKVVEKQRAKGLPIPTAAERGEPYTVNEQLVTRVARLSFVDADGIRPVLGSLMGQGADLQVLGTDTLILTDTGANLHRLEKLLAQLDVRGGADELRVVPLRHALATEVAEKLGKLLEPRAGKPAGRSGATPQLFAEERTNKLLILSGQEGFERILALLRELDVPIAQSGRLHVLHLTHAKAEELAATLQAVTQGSGRPAGAPKGGELFSGEVKVAADKATNSLVVVAAQADWRSVLEVVESLDVARQQVFVEAVILEVSLNRGSATGVTFHGGTAAQTSVGPVLGAFGTRYSDSLGLPSFDLKNLAAFSGFLAGLQGPVSAALKELGIPDFGVVLHALQQSADVNVISTPHILATDNEESELAVGQKIPFRTSVSTAQSAAQTALTGYLPQDRVERTPVELKLLLRPQISEGGAIRLSVVQEAEELSPSPDKGLGPTTSTRRLKTTLVAHDQETVVLGGILQEHAHEQVSKVPVLGDIPLLGQLFRDTTKSTVKTNLLVFLTPYIIRDSSDFRRIFERKLAERRRFAEQTFGTGVAVDDFPIDFGRKRGPLAVLADAVSRAARKAENGGPGDEDQKVIRPDPP